MNVVEETDSTHRGNDTEQKKNNNRSNEFSFKIKRLARQLHVAVLTFCSSVFFIFVSITFNAFCFDFRPRLSY